MINQVYLYVLYDFHQSSQILKVPTNNLIENPEIFHVLKKVIHVCDFHLDFEGGINEVLAPESLGVREVKY